MSGGSKPIVNPYKRRQPLVPHNEIMGRQSQQRISNTKRAFSLASNTSARKRAKGGQTTLQGGIAFVSERDCQVCRAQSLAKLTANYRIPKRSHHQFCIKNTKTKGHGAVSAHNMACRTEEKRLEALFRAPLNSHEKGSAVHTTKEAAQAFFQPVKARNVFAQQNQQAKVESVPSLPTTTDPINYCRAVTAMTSDPVFQEKHKNKGTPLAMLAFASEVVDRVIRKQLISSSFNGITMTVPEYPQAEPQYHSIMGQKLLLVDWARTHGIQCPCADASCTGILTNDRTNFSKNKTLFPIFGLDGAPTWCMVMTMVCTKCKRRFDANDGEVLLTLPAHVASTYPVEIKYALSNKSCHLHRNATEVVVDSIMLTYGNGELCSRLLYNSINRAYMQRLMIYYSYAQCNIANNNNKPTAPYVAKDGDFIKQYPPLGDTIRDMYDEACSSNNNPWGISDHDRNTFEIQGVKCDRGIFAQDHTFEVIKNYQNNKRLGAKAAWTVGTSTGEVAAVVLVPSTKTKHFSHAARMLMSRECFTPTVMYSDTWPHKIDYWNKLVKGGIEGRLGLFHYEKRMLRTLRKKHIDYHEAVGSLLAAIYSYDSADYEKLLSALKDGSLSASNKKHSAADIADLKGTKVFRDRYGKFLRKSLWPPETMVQNLDDWFCRYKVTASDPIGGRPAEGRLDPIHGVPLFTHETKEAVENCKEKAKFLTDPFPLEDMYDRILPSPNSQHNLTEYLSRRGESKLEAFHDRFAHFANSGMRNSLADNLNLMGTARYNLAIRYKRTLIVDNNNNKTRRAPIIDRRTIPGAWEKVLPFHNHSELAYVNRMAAALNLPDPFPYAEPLPKDNGERFFSEYLTIYKPATLPYDDDDICICVDCNAAPDNTTPILPPRKPPLPAAVPPKQSASDVCLRQQPKQQRAPMPTVFARPLVFPSYYACLPIPPPFAHTTCCAKHQAWLARRVGRPPHDAHCQHKVKQQQQRLFGFIPEPGNGTYGNPSGWI